MEQIMITFPKYRLFRLSATFQTEREKSGAAASVSSQLMPAGANSADTIKEWIDDMKSGILKKDPTASAISTKLYQFPKRRTWAATWFEHWTYRCPEMDTRAKALASFREYVHEVGMEFPEDDVSLDNLHDNPGYIVLMGASEEWRWRGSRDTPSTPGGDGKAPCACEHCEKEGIWRIAH